MAVDIGALQASLTEFGAEVFVEAAGILRDEVAEAAPVGETGEVRDGIQAQIGAVGIVSTGAIVATSEHSSFSNDGTSPHQIDGNPLLAFQWGGQTVIVHSVAHPGNAATHWFDNSADEAHWLAALDQAVNATPLT